MQNVTDNGKKMALTILTGQKIDGRRENDRIETMADVYQREQSVHILYQENQTKTHIRITGKTVHIHRLGALSGDLWFVEGAERDTRYETPYGRMMLTLDTHRIDWDEKKRRLYIRYNVLTDGALVSMNEITIEIKERKQYEKSGQ